MAFTNQTTDWDSSPYTGLTRESWKQAGRYLLSGIFDHLESPEDPPLVKRTEFDATYPHRGATGAVLDRERRAEIFEGLARSFFTASVLIREDPDIQINGISLREYYREHIQNACTRPAHPEYVSTYQELASQVKNPNATFQQTVETCALCIGLWACREQIWAAYSKGERDALAAFLKGYAEAPTVPQNWRLFNMLDLAFLDMEGYPIDHSIMIGHASAILGYACGDGWYRDGQSFDYYGCWAFQVYAPLWCLWYGKRKLPWIAKRYEEIGKEFIKTYPAFFDREGRTTLWGRSCIYRNASTSPLSTHFLYEDPILDPGLARRIASGSLLQFFTRDDFLAEGAPSLGFYGTFPPLVQGYSCAESPFWLGKAFLCLLLPEGHPFWTATEAAGPWEDLGDESFKETLLDGPGICTCLHGGNGEMTLRTGKVVKSPADIEGADNYGKLSYNSEFPWEATTFGEWDAQMPATAGQYLLKAPEGDILWPNAILWAGQKDGVLYRRAFFHYILEEETHWTQALNLCDIPMPRGILRIDRLRPSKYPLTLTLGAYGFPFQEGTLEVLTKESPEGWGKEEEGNAKALRARATILHGLDPSGKELSLSLTIYPGWEEICQKVRTGVNPKGGKSCLLYGITHREKHYDGTARNILLSQVLTKEGAPDFPLEELFPIRQLQTLDEAGAGTYGPITLYLADGRTIVVDDLGIEGRLQL